MPLLRNKILVRGCAGHNRLAISAKSAHPTRGAVSRCAHIYVNAIVTPEVSDLDVVPG
jgi:hypothetical protein